MGDAGGSAGSLDELSSFKNHQSQRWKALRKVRPQIRRMVGLTGTPASNGLMDLWAETFLIDKGIRLGRFIGRYREAYFRAAGMNPYTGVVYNYLPLPGAEQAIFSKISDISVSMKALDYLDMPEQVTVNHWVEMDAAERQVYDDMKADLLTHIDGNVIEAANAAVLSGKLLQMANGAVYSADARRSVLRRYIMVSINGTSISVTRGDTLDITIEILYPDGTPYTVMAGDVIRFALKQRYTDPEPLICKEIPHAGMNLRLEAEETKALKAGGAPYVYDIQITMEGGTVCTFIDRAKFTVTEEVD